MPMRNLVIVPHDPRWAAAFEGEAAQLRPIFGNELLALHHIGSTAVPGLAAKPILDLMPVVRDITQVDSLNEALAGLGYQARGENGIPDRRYFTRGEDAHRTHHMHCYGPDSPEVSRHLDFRDYLRAHPATAEEYGRLKAVLAQQFPNDITAYVAGKAGFILETLHQAQAWRAEAAPDAS